MVVRRHVAVLAAVAGVVLTACASGDESFPLDSRPTAISSSPATDSDGGDSAVTTSGGAADPPTSVGGADVVNVTIDVASPSSPISPLILGLSAVLTPADTEDAGVTLSSWGGNPSTRYNYEIGNAWNHGADYEFRNTNYGEQSGSAVNRHLSRSADAGVATRLAVPTLGWVARNDDDATCSFPDGSGGCLPSSEVGTCADDGPIADPATANVASTPEAVTDWVARLVADGLEPDIIAMDNEPELWGSTHYDVHPECPTYEEVLDTYLTYARAIRQVAPESKLAGPVMCCWYDYWGTAPGPADGSNEDFLSWFLRNVKAHDDEYGGRTLDYVDVHYYPQSDVYNAETDEETSARRLRSTRSLWDPNYSDESWIGETIRFIPRMKETIERSYPGTPLLISEWNFGADGSMNGAIAVAEVLGIFGREGVDAATYWQAPEVGSPGYFAFKMHGNYDDQGSRFGGDVLTATSSDQDLVSAFAALDEADGVIRVMLINKDPERAHGVVLGFDGGQPTQSARTFTYSGGDPAAVASGSADLSQPVSLAASSITVVEVDLT